MKHQYTLGIWIYIGMMLWAAWGCNPIKRPTTLQPITGNNTSTTPDTVRNTNPNSRIVIRDTVRPPVRVAWCDTIQEGRYKQLVVCYEKIGNSPIKADTIKILNTDPNAIFPPQHQDTAKIIRLKDRYNVVIAMPFLSNRFKGGEDSEIDPQSLKSLEFYEGVRIAFDSLQREGVKLNVYVCDTKSGEETMRQLLQKEEFINADLIVGPVADEQLKLTAEFAQQHQIPLISPFNPKDNMVEENPFYIQVNPSYVNHGERIMKFVEANKSKNPKLLIMGTSHDSARIEQIQQAYAVWKNDEQARIPQVISGKTANSTGSMRGSLSGGGMNIVIMPTYKDEVYVYNMLRELQSVYDKPEQRGDNNEHIVVIGMPQWKYFEGVNIEYYENLNVHLTAEFAVDESQDVNRHFIRAYSALYGMPPRDFAYVGFDIMLYFGRMLKEYGRGFPEFFFKKVDSRRHTIFNFEPVYQMRGSLDGMGNTRYEPKIIRYENQYVNMVKFDNFYFQKVY